VFPVTLPGGRFLVIGVDVARIGPPPEDAMSLRAYKETAGQFKPVANIELVRGDSDAPELRGGLQVAALRSQPVPGEFWFIAWARVESARGAVITLRVYGFDGTRFRTVAATGDVLVDGFPQAVRTTQDGFSVTRLVDETKRRLIEEYAVTANGPVKLSK
jgi:hypothetical protein